MGDEEKLDIFDSCLSSGLRHLTQYLLEGEEDIAFEHVFSLLEEKYAKGLPTGAPGLGKFNPYLTQPWQNFPK